MACSSFWSCCHASRPGWAAYLFAIVSSPRYWPPHSAKPRNSRPSGASRCARAASAVRSRATLSCWQWPPRASFSRLSNSAPATRSSWLVVAAQTHSPSRSALGGPSPIRAARKVLFLKSPRSPRARGSANWVSGAFCLSACAGALVTAWMRRDRPPIAGCWPFRPPVQRSDASVDQLLSHGDGMGPIGCAQHSEQRRQVHFDGTFRDVERLGDFLVRLALDETHQHLALPVGQTLHGLHPRHLRARARLDRPLCQNRRHVNFSGKDVTQPLDQLVRMLALDDVAVHASRERAQDILPAVRGAEHDDLRLRAPQTHLRKALGTGQPWHPQIDDGER